MTTRTNTASVDLDRWIMLDGKGRETFYPALATGWAFRQVPVYGGPAVAAPEPCVRPVDVRGYEARVRGRK